MTPTNKIIIIGGPTATGKTSIGLDLSKLINGEILNADSRQIYRFMDIGTDKGKLTKTSDSIDLKGKKIDSFLLGDSNVKGWLFDLINPDEYFSIANFQELVMKLFQKMWREQKIPIVVGGTGLYIDSIIKKYQLEISPPDFTLRNSLKNKSPEELCNIIIEMTGAKPVLNESDIHNPQRLIRYIEKLKNVKITTNSVIFPNFEYVFIYPKYQKEELTKKIEKRVHQMIENGLVSEVEKLISLGYADTKPLNGIGYKEVQEFLNKKINHEQMLSKIILAHTQYAKRQSVWFEGAGRNYSLKKFDFIREKALLLDYIQDFIHE